MNSALSQKEVLFLRAIEAYTRLERGAACGASG
jgi:hypothetical protein